jgi:hypothetical protein
VTDTRSNEIEARLVQQGHRFRAALEVVYGLLRDVYSAKGMWVTRLEMKRRALRLVRRERSSTVTRLGRNASVRNVPCKSSCCTTLLETIKLIN